MIKKPLICIVEDNEMVRNSMEMLIEAWGYDARAFASAEDLLSYQGETSFDCMIFDFNLPGINALECIDRLNEQSKQAPTIVVSGTLDEAKSLLLKELGVVAVMGKPVIGKDLLSAVESAIQMA